MTITWHYTLYVHIMTPLVVHDQGHYEAMDYCVHLSPGQRTSLILYAINISIQVDKSLVYCKSF